MSISSKVTDQLNAIENKKEHNTFIHVDRKNATQRAGELDRLNERVGPLHGMTLAIKDNIAVAGMPLTGGTPLSVDPHQDCTVIQRLRAAGAILLGKTNLHELAFGVLSTNSTYGHVGCAFDVNSFAGGSSGGSAVAVALGMCDAALGTDTAGSVRIPASLNGIVGFKPSIGRYETDGVIPLSFTRDVIGPMTKDVETAALLDSVMAGEEVEELNPREANTIRLGIPTTEFWTGLEDYVEKITSGSRQKLETAGVTCVPVDVSHIIAQINSSSDLHYEEYKVLLPSVLKQFNFNGTQEDFVEHIGSPDVRKKGESTIRGPGPESEAYQKAIALIRPTVQQMYYELFREQNLDGLLFPSTKVTAQKKSEHPKNNRKTYVTYAGNTNPASYTGLPSLVIPAGPGAGVGIQVDGKFRADRDLLRVGLTLQQILLKKDVE